MLFFNSVELGLFHLILILILFFIFLSIARIMVLRNIFYLIKQNYSFYFSKINQSNLSFTHFLTSGKSMLLGIKIIFNPEYEFDTEINAKKKFYVFFSLWYYLTLIIMIYLITLLYF